MGLVIAVCGMPASGKGEFASILASKGIDTSMLKPKSVDLFKAEDFDMVISMGCGVSCPVMRIDQDWGLDDPVGQSLSVFEQTAAEIERRLKLLE